MKRSVTRTLVLGPSLFFTFLLFLNSTVLNATTYYVSSSEGSDANLGQSSDKPFETITKVNDLDLVAGDSVLFKCGDTWRGEMLVITRSGSTGNPITYSSYPFECLDKPVLSGSRVISGWQLYSPNIYMADLAEGNNIDTFPLGINQLFADGVRLPIGRWPNIDQDDGGDNFHNGYSIIDTQPAGNRIIDDQLTGSSWVGGTVHIKGMRWYILNRDITAVSGTSLTLNADAGCWGDSCQGWGYFINNHLQTLDQNGEWYYDDGSGRVYLYSDSGSPSDREIEGSVILKDDDRYWGAIVLGKDLNEHISYVTIDNFSIINGFRNGISTPTNLATHENSFLTIRNNEILNMDSTGIKLATWVWNAQDGRPAGWRGGYSQDISDNVIDGANHYGIDTYSRNSTFVNNTIRNIGVIGNFNESGLGCGNDGSGGNCTENGDGFRIKVGNADDTGHNNILQGNRIEEIAYNGVDIFGHTNSLIENVIVRPCITKGDCGAVRTYGGTNLSSTPVYDLTIRDNIILDSVGNTDGTHSTYRSLFGFGLYIDQYSKNVESEGNTIANSTSHGILYQNSTGTVIGNSLYNNVSSSSWGAQFYITSGSSITSSENNIMYGLQDSARTLSTGLSNLSASNNNYFFNPYNNDNILSGTAKSLEDWLIDSGMDENSVKNWFTLADGTAPLSEIFINDSDIVKTVSLTNKRYRDLDQNIVEGEILLQPYSSQILVYDSLVLPDLVDCISILQIVAGQDSTDSLSIDLHDIDGDGALGLGDVIGILGHLAE